MEVKNKEKEITESIKTFGDAYFALKDKKPQLIDNYDQWANYVEGNDPQLRAFLQLRIVIASLNEGWEPRFTEYEQRYYP